MTLLVAVVVGAGMVPAVVAAAPATGAAASTRAASSTGPRLHEDDYGRTVRVHVGERIRVGLPNNSFGGYRQPTSPGSELVRRTASGGYPTDQPARAVFVAVHRGRTDITATTDYACLHAEPQCAIAQRDWLVHVRVRR